MALAKDLIDVIIYDNGPNDISNGILSIDIQFGVDSWEGPWQQPDAGRFTIVSRNKDIDPNVNPLIKFNQQIVFKTKDDQNVFFTGYITDINVEYQLNDNPIITINGTDNLGLFKRILVTQEMLDAKIPAGLGNGPYQFEEFMELVQYYFDSSNLLTKIPFQYEFIQGLEQSGGSLGVPMSSYRPAKYIPELGESLWDVLVKYAQTNLDFIYVDPISGLIYIYPFFKYYADYWVELEDPNTFYASERTFDSVDTPYQNYQTITIDQNFNKITNQVKTNNIATTWNGTAAVYTNAEFGPYDLTQSIDDWGYSELSLSTLMPPAQANDAEFIRYSTDIFEQVGIPSTEVGEISFDNVLRRLEQYVPGQVVRVKHKVNNSLTINKLYSIAGIRFSINDRDWIGTFVFKPSGYQETYDHQQLHPNASISLNATTGDTNYNFTATLNNFPSGDIDIVYWGVIDAGFINETASLYSFAYNGTAFKDDNPRNGMSLTCNFDDGGIVSQDGPGFKYIYAFVIDTSGYTRLVVSPQISVTAAQVHADFGYSLDIYDAVTFLDNSSVDTDTWTWDFGDGSSYDGKYPYVKYYSTPGTYNVSLTVSNGITTNTKTIPVTITNTKLSVRYLKYTWNMTRTRANNTSPWNKNFITDLREISIINTSSNNVALNAPIHAVTRKGTITNGTGGAITFPNTVLTNNTTTSTELKLNPLVSNNGNTQELDLDIVIDLAYKYQSGPTAGYYFQDSWWGTGPAPIQIGQRFKITDSYLFYNSVTAGLTYEPIQVSASSDGTNYYPIGSFNINPSTSGAGIWSLDNKPLMPPLTSNTPSVSSPAFPQIPLAKIDYSIGNDGAYINNKYSFYTDSAYTTTYSWNFGDSTPLSTLQNPIHIYAYTGPGAGYVVGLFLQKQYQSKNWFYYKQITVDVDPV